jgi:hypothetical protein
MNLQNSNDSTTAAPSQAEPASHTHELLSWLPWQEAAVLVSDEIESVRWMEHDEDPAITQFVHSEQTRSQPFCDAF